MNNNALHWRHTLIHIDAGFENRPLLSNHNFKVKKQKLAAVTTTTTGDAAIFF